MISIALSVMIGIHCLQSLMISSQEEYTIADGSANLYKITANDLLVEYIPVKPENSSSGFYSGGQYVKKTITKEQYSILSQKIQNVLKNKKNRIKERVKGSFAVTVKKGGKENSYLIASGGDEIKELESFLKELIR